jgi:hypothetical protein
MSINRTLNALEKEVKNNINSLSSDEIIQEYGIIIQSDGQVFDVVEDKKFKNIDSWIEFYLDDSEEDIEWIGAGKGYFDD